MTPSAALLRAMRKMLPDAQIALVHERPWHSLTFAGSQICISLVLSGKDHVTAADTFARMLPACEFNLQSWLVADIAAREATGSDHETRLLIDALVLED